MGKKGRGRGTKYVVSRPDEEEADDRSLVPVFDVQLYVDTMIGTLKKLTTVGMLLPGVKMIATLLPLPLVPDLVEFLALMASKPHATIRTLNRVHLASLASLIVYITSDAESTCRRRIQDFRVPFTTIVAPSPEYPDGKCTDPIAVWVGPGNAAAGFLRFSAMLEGLTETIDVEKFWAESIPGVFAEGCVDVALIGVEFCSTPISSHYINVDLEIPKGLEHIGDAIVQWTLAENTANAKYITKHALCLCTIGSTLVTVDFSDADLQLPPGVIVVKSTELADVIGPKGTNLSGIKRWLDDKFEIILTRLPWSVHAHHVVTVKRCTKGAVMTRAMATIVLENLFTPDEDEDYDLYDYR